MKRILIGVLAMAALIAVQTGSSNAASVADYPAGIAAGGIGASRHNLGSYGRVLTTNATSEICVFCHTPHHTNSADTDYRPLWNKGNPAGPFTAYGTTLGGNSATTIGGTSLACLGCHDGVTTFDNIVNAPGKKGITAGTNKTWLFFMPGGDWSHTNFDNFGAGICSGCHSGAEDYATNIQRLNIGTNLSNDHPVSIAYDANVAGLRPTGTVINSIDLAGDLAASASTAFGGNLAQNRWAVKGFISNTATIGDLLRNNKVECSSCHDPHFRNLSWDEAEPSWYNVDVGKTNWCGNDVTGENCSDGNFLRRVGGNTGSGVCRTCHNK